MGQADNSRGFKRTVFVTVGTTCFDALVKVVDSQPVKDELFKKGYTDLLIQMGRGTYTPSKLKFLPTMVDKHITMNGLGGCLLLDYFIDLQFRSLDVLAKMGFFGQFSYRVTMDLVLGMTLFVEVVKHGVFSSSAQIHLEKSFVHRMRVNNLSSHIEISKQDGSLEVDYFTFSPSLVDYMRSASLIVSHAGSGSIFEALQMGKPLIVVVNEDLMDNHQSELAEELAERKHLLCARPQTLDQVIKSMDLESLIPYPPADSTPVAKHINRFLGFPDD